MIRLLDIVSKETTGIIFKSIELDSVDKVAYILYDTYPEEAQSQLPDYITWRSLSELDTTLDTVVFKATNSCLFPSYTTPISDYLVLRDRGFKVLTFMEYEILQSLLTRLDLVRRRLPNPGSVISDTDGVGQGGVVSFAGGFDKKFSVDELMQFIEGALVEINIHPPASTYYWYFTSVQEETVYTNPYSFYNGVPYKMFDLIIQGALIRALISWGILEVDIHFTASDSGLQITYDRASHVKGWHDTLLAEYAKQKDLVKWDCVNSYGVGVGTVPFAALGIIGAATNMIQEHGVLPMNTLVGFFSRGYTPL